jgi:hypothetical protein
MRLVAHRDVQTNQHPRLTLAWAVHGLEVALQKLGDGHAEQRVRKQFHQLLLAVERHNSITPETERQPFSGLDHQQAL